jgi:TnpA family transposase
MRSNDFESLTQRIGLRVLRAVDQLDFDAGCAEQYVDTHGQSEVGFAFCYLLGFALLPRLKNIKKQRLYRPQKGELEKYANLQPILTRPINWEIIEQQYDQLIKFATALRLAPPTPNRSCGALPRATSSTPPARHCVSWARL